ncbi:MAG: type IV secretion system protein [Candidatus Berkelbacteria bacterium]|nr:type IV secretion system protein [Candidatus Berkelbacteria bacterium]
MKRHKISQIKSKLIKGAFYLVFISTLIFLPGTSSAKNWNNPGGGTTTGTGGGEAALGGTLASTDPETICENLFHGDPTNIYRTTICDLTKVIALSVSNLATEITCSIQTVGNAGNYWRDIHFTRSRGGCTPESRAFSITETSQLTNSLTLNPETGTGGLIAPTPTTTSATEPTQVPSAFALIRNIVSVLVFIAIIILAFAKILHIEVSSYSIKKMLPTVVLAVIGAWLSIYAIFIISRLIDFMYTISPFAPQQAFHPMLNIFGGPLTASSSLQDSLSLVFNVGGKLLGISAASAQTASFITGLFGTILLVIPSLIVIMFEYVLALRAFAVGFLTVTAPIAFACLILPQTQVIFRKWLSYLLIALFYAPIVNFAFFILNAFPAAHWEDGNAVSFLALWVFKIAVIAILVRLPFTVESDLRRLTVALSRTSFGASLGIGRLAAALEPKKPISQPAAATDRIFSSQLTKKIVADTSTRFARITTRERQRQVEGIKTEQFIARTALPELANVLSRANQTNLSRPTNLLARSVADLSPEVFKAVVDKSDLQLWRDTRLVEQLKNQNGQILDDQGAAIRADSARKLVRLSEAVENGTIKNPDALKLLAQKGALGNVSYPVIKKALQDGILTKPDLAPTFKNQTERVFQQLQTIETRNLRFSSQREVNNQITQDHLDYSTGFKDIAGLIERASLSPQVSSPPSPPLVRMITDQIKNISAEGIEKHGDYFLRRLSQIQKASQTDIASALQRSGVNKQISTAVSQNPQITHLQAISYIPKPNQTPTTIGNLREGFVTRDLAGSLNSEISNLVSEEKLSLARGVTQKVTQDLKSNPSLDLSQIKNTLEQSLNRLSKPISPQQVQEISKTVDKYHPVATVKLGVTPQEGDIEKLKEKVKGALESVDYLIEAKVNKDSLVQNPADALKSVEDKVKEKIAKASVGLEEEKAAPASPDKTAGQKSDEAPKVESPSVEQTITQAATK